jgi:hypothetical protein
MLQRNPVSLADWPVPFAYWHQDHERKPEVRNRVRARIPEFERSQELFPYSRSFNHFAFQMFPPAFGRQTASIRRLIVLAENNGPLGEIDRFLHSVWEQLPDLSQDRAFQRGLQHRSIFGIERGG